MFRPALALLLLSAPLAAQGAVLVVDMFGGGDFTSVQAAVDAAAEGDTILLRGSFSSYERFTIDGKSLSVVGQDPDPNLAWCGLNDPTWGIGSMANGHQNQIRNLGPGQVVVLSHLGLGGLEVEDVDGQVWLQSCSLSVTAPVVRADGVDRFVLQDCTIVSPDGDWTPESVIVAWGHGLEAIDSHLVIEGCHIEGGDGIDYTSVLFSAIAPAPGSDGIKLSGGSLWIADSMVSGGHGGQSGCLDGFCFDGCDGGAGLRLGTGAPTVWSLGNTFTGGLGTAAPGPEAEPGVDGAPIEVTSGTLESIPGTPRTFSVSSPVSEGQSTSLLLGGEAGEQVLVLVSLDPSLLPMPLKAGALQVVPSRVLFVGTLPPSGALSFTVPIVALGPGFETIELFVQAAFCAAGCRLGPAGALNLFDGSF